MEQNLESPQYLALSDKIASLCDAVKPSIVNVAMKLAAHKLITLNDCDVVVNAVSAARDPDLIFMQLMKPVRSKIGFSPDSFYDLVDALNESPLVVPVGKDLEEHCGESSLNENLPSIIL